MCISNILYDGFLLVNEKHLFFEYVDKALDPALVYDVFSQFSIPPGSVIFRLSDIMNGAIPTLPKPILCTYQTLIRASVNRLGINPKKYAVECWSNRTSEVGPRVDYHIDNDEKLRRETGRLSIPKWGAIYHVGPAALEVGGTWFNPPLADPLLDDRLFSLPLFSDVVSPKGRFVRFHPGRLIMFDGRCPHCVAPFGPLSTPRVTILLNFWTKCHKKALVSPRS